MSRESIILFLGSKGHLLTRVSVIVRCEVALLAKIFVIASGFSSKRQASEFLIKASRRCRIYKRSQLVTKTAAEIVCHCSYALSAEGKQVGE